MSRSEDATVALDRAFEALKTFGWGQDRLLLKPIDDALRALQADAAASRSLEARLAAVLSTDAPEAAKDHVCRRLSESGSAASVPALAAVLADEKLSHRARLALERIPGPEASGALRGALAKCSGKLLAGVIHSLGRRRDGESIAALAEILARPEPLESHSAAWALGQIGTVEAARALREKTPEALRRDTADARLACAEQLVAAGNRREASAIYEALNSQVEPEHVRLAASRGLSAATEKGASSAR